MRRWLFSLTGVVALLALLACAAKEEAKPAPAAPAAAPAAPAPAPAAPAPAAKPAWEEEWERLLAAAKREGTVVVAQGTGAAALRYVPFEKRYGIKVEVLAQRSSVFMPRIKAERAAGQYLWDVAQGGLTSWVPYLEFLDPIEPALILPEVKDPKNWWEGKLYFLDNDPRLLAMSLVTSSPTFINTDLVKPGEIKSYKDLLDPKWKGKLLSSDPRVPGAAQSQYSFFYQHPELGPDFIRALAKQDLTISRDLSQQLEWLAQGKFPILLGGSRPSSVPLIKAGLPILNMDPTGMKEGAALAVSVGHLLLINRAPHPNAARVFINWMLTQEGQLLYNRHHGIASLRLDVANDWMEPWELPQKGYIRLVGLEEEKMRRKAGEFLVEVFGR